MYRFVFFTLISIVHSLSGQITISQGDFVTPYDTIRYSQFVGPVDYESSGPNYLWDFSQVVASSQNLKEYNQISQIGFLVQATYGSFAPTNYQASYFYKTNDLPVEQLNQFLPVTLNNLNTFIKKSTNQLTKVGYSINVNGNDVPFSSDTIETRYLFPLNYLDSFSSVGYTFVDLNPIVDLKIKQHISSTITVDGFGQLSLPNGVFEVLRVKRDNIEIDSIYQSFNGAGTWIAPPVRYYTNYEWLALNKGDVLLSLTVASMNGQNQIQSAEYQDEYLGLDVSLDEIPKEIKLFPNPSAGPLKINSSEPIEEIKVFDQFNKRIVALSPINKKNLTIELDDNTSGVYFIEIKLKTGVVFYERILKI